MIELTVGNVTRTQALVEGSLQLWQYGDLRSSLRATLHYETVPLNFPKAGQEILLWEDETLLWGGILVETEQECHSTRSFTMTLRGQGYEQILQRYCLPKIQLDPCTPSEAVRQIFQNHLNPMDGLSLGEVDEGLSQQFAYSFDPVKASSVFDRLAKDNGYVWWIDKNKIFHMKALLPQKEPSVCIDLTNKKENRLQDLQTLVCRSSTAGYKNMQYVYNRATGAVGKYIHPDRLSEMTGRFGGGMYGSSASNSAVVNQAQANAVAEQILRGNPGLTELEFTTDSDVFLPGQILQVTAPVCGIKEERSFCITEIRAVYFYNRFRYTVTARETDFGPLTTGAWEAILAYGSENTTR